MGFACLLTQIKWFHQAPKSARTFSHKKEKSWTRKRLSHICSNITSNLQRGRRRVLNPKQTVQSYSQLAQGKIISTGLTMFVMR